MTSTNLNQAKYQEMLLAAAINDLWNKPWSKYIPMAAQKHERMMQERRMIRWFKEKRNEQTDQPILRQQSSSELPSQDDGARSAELHDGVNDSGATDAVPSSVQEVGTATD